MNWTWRGNEGNSVKSTPVFQVHSWSTVIDSGTMLLGPLVWAASLASIIMHYMGL